MNHLQARLRQGTTLVELLIYMAVLAVVSVAIFPLLFASTEDRLLQETVSLVEQNGIQILQGIGTRIAHAESILSPSAASSASVLALHSGSGAMTPIIIGLHDGVVQVVEKTDLQDMSSSQVAVSNLRFRNTSVSTNRQSIEVTFTVSRAIRLQAPHSYSQSFQGVFTLYPDDVREASSCSCAMPGCDGANTYIWQVCESGSCLESQTPMICP